MSREVWTIDVKKMLKNNARMTVLLSAIIALVVSSFATVPPVNALAMPLSHVSMMNSPDEAGYIGNLANSPGGFTRATAQWTQPTIICQPNLPKPQKLVMELAIHGGGGQTGFAIVIVGFCPQGSSTPIYLSAANFANGTASPTPLILTVNAGDVFSASITFNRFNAIFTGRLADLTTGQSTSVSVANPDFLLVAGSLLASWLVTGIRGTGPGIPLLGQFSVPVRFSNCTVTVSGQTFTISQIGTVTRLTMVNATGSTLATASRLTRHGSSFTVTWVSST